MDIGQDSLTPKDITFIRCELTSLRKLHPWFKVRSSSKTIKEVSCGFTNRMQRTVINAELLDFLHYEKGEKRDAAGVGMRDSEHEIKMSFYERNGYQLSS